MLQEHERLCHLPDFSGNNKTVLVLPVARAASESLTKAMYRAGQPRWHCHHCRVQSLFAKAGENIREVVVPLRDPVARIVSGYQRRCERHFMSKVENRLLVEDFTSLNSFIDALRDSSHEKHALAMTMVYKHGSQNYFLPVMEFYLADAPLDRVRFICTCHLKDDVAELGHHLQLPVSLQDRSRLHASKQDSDSPSVQQQFLSEENMQWLRKIYAADYALFYKHCSCP